MNTTCDKLHTKSFNSKQKMVTNYTLEKLHLFHCMEIFWKYCRKSLENPISIVLSKSIVWKCCPWYEKILEILSKYSGNKIVFPV